LLSLNCLLVRNQQGLELDKDESLPHQFDTAQWPTLKQTFTKRFLSRTRDEWTRVFDGLDACVTPVLELPELMQHQHNKDRCVRAGVRVRVRWCVRHRN
jgi:crotonobetainyl-CoA:carnitine CoA-transferase CaiB-like acyl-CoA transferase